ncbi:MAG TPA: zincin-like metallopeptidase domain-containing protein [Candidatus Polarisedimenticolia bacterium]|nr:zincin-like metallopeptidase domain-containing protein [Candidatus Polarisedimenticolia bacterium]
MPPAFTYQISGVNRSWNAEPSRIRARLSGGLINPSRDVVTMPSRTAFDSQEEYYSTLFHELIHATGHASD